LFPDIHTVNGCFLIQNQELRLCLGAFRTSPQESLHTAAFEMPVYLRAHKLALQYALKLFDNQSNPAHNIVFNPEYTQKYETKPNIIHPFGLHIK
jgi:hypothetical protein